MGPPIQIFLTTIGSQAALRQRQEYILRILQTKNITFSSYDLASDEDAKRLWRRKAPVDKQQLPGILVGGTCPGSFTDFEEAVEYGELETFLRLNEKWDESIENTYPTLPVKPIGVPGASSPSQMAKPAHKALFNVSPAGSPLRGGAAQSVDKSALRKRNDSEFDVSEELTGYGLQGVKVTQDDLLALIEELGLGGDEADDLVKGLSDFTDKGSKKNAVKEQAAEPAKLSEVEDEATAHAESSHEGAGEVDGGGEKVEVKVTEASA
ncbi:hypothetical protein BC834DRAFT_859312 [Gloeopeniophorella convolvens]|nr:hypothetical protein BC834DRAFT_859312 [Gloeopeniophorella convolvens]